MMLRSTVAVVSDPARIVKTDSETLWNGSAVPSGSVAVSYIIMVNNVNIFRWKDRPSGRRDPFPLHPEQIAAELV